MMASADGWRKDVLVRIFPFVLLQVFSFFLSPSSASSTTNRNTYNVYNYDQTTPQFTPDGRLLQVEYASSAADLSPPLVVFECLSTTYGTSDNDDEHRDEDANDNSQSYPCTVLIAIPKESNSPQHRIVIIEETDDGKQERLPPMLSRLNRSYCVAMSGILADSLALLQAGMKAAGQHTLQYQMFFGMESLAQAVADECQSRVFAGGLRPYGSTLVLCGYDCDDGYRAKSSESLIYQTDPSGGILQHYTRPNTYDDKEKQRHHHYESSAATTFGVPKKKKKSLLRRKDAADKNGAIKSRVRCVVGGSPSLQRQLHKRIDQALVKFENNLRQNKQNRREPSLAERIACVAKILIQETTKGDVGAKNNDEASHAEQHGSSESSSNRTLEIVLVSPTLGCHRLDDRQLRAIQELVRDEKSRR
ncbi:unnamed protein product [Pseudo-nitzschia multistriata]|uniref:Proteasome alpha-type subunits domain-containing protein n=1 Tax=Pseudo-nitzschia multistriata TaxID=183589 RepID=A0A448ZDD8_9STRA|nr:unnamed protein product [Pseudo-nitzschia multistriata]